MKTNIWGRLSFIVVIFILALSVALPNRDGAVFGVPVPSFFPNVDLSLGLDLQGGTQLRYALDLSKVPADRTQSVISGVQEVIRRRVDNLGVAEPVIQMADVGEQKHLIVELPGVKNLDDAKAMVGKVMTLQFKEQQTEITEEEQTRADEENIRRSEVVDTISLTLQEGSSLEDGAATDSLATFYRSIDFENENKINPDLLTVLEGLTDGSSESAARDSASDWQFASRTESIVEDVKEVSASHILVAYQGAERAKPEVVRTKEEALNRAQEVLAKVNAGEDFATLAKEMSDESTETGELPAPVKNGGAYVAEFTDATLLLENVGDVTLEPVESPFGYHIITARDIEVNQETLYKYETLTVKKDVPASDGWKETELTSEHFDYAAPNFDPNSGQIYVEINFTTEGKDVFAAITKRNLQKPVAIFLDDNPIIGDTVYAPVVQAEITDGKAMITGNMNHKLATELAQNLNAGAIPAPISLIGQRTVGATLGKAALADGLKAGGVGILILFVYMMLFYRMSGVVASLALAMYSVILVALFKLWPVTLTLAGIAGVIFSIGIAVDANILIFERMREAVKNGKSSYQAIQEGFAHAWSSIRDSNTSGLLICLVLFFFGAGMIRGFALTLSLGILLSLFSAIFITKTLLLFLAKIGVSPQALIGGRKK